MTHGSYSIGWNVWPPEKGGPAFIISRYNLAGTRKILPERYPPTEEGWNSAWTAFEKLSPKEVTIARNSIENRERRIEAEQAQEGNGRALKQLAKETLTLLDELTFLGGHTPGMELSTQSIYSVRFLSDRLAIFRSDNTVKELGKIPYSDLLDLQIGGPGAVKSVSPIVGPAQTIAGSAIRAIQPGVNPNILTAENGAISAALKAAGTRTKIKTVLFIQSSSSELFFLSTTLEPDQLRINLSPAISKIREIFTEPAGSVDPPQSSGQNSTLGDLEKAVEWLDRGLITRDEFDRIKSKLISGD